MKKFLCIFLFVCFIAPFLGTYIWLQCEKNHIKEAVKRQMIAGMEKKELVHLKFTKAETKTELRWEHSKEFEYKGEMYDIIETVVIGDTISYVCWWDHEETNLNKQLKELIAQALGNNTQNNKDQPHLANFLKSLYHTGKPAWDALYSSTNKTFFSTHSIHYISYNPPPLTPPPETV